MNYEKCPRCELNYKRIEEKYCVVCQRELNGESFDDEENDEQLCVYCGLRPIVKNEMCEKCLEKYEYDW